MKKNTHYVFGNNFYSYDVEFWGDILQLILINDRPCCIENIGKYNVGKYVEKGPHGSIIYKPLNMENIKRDLSLPCNSRMFFTRTTIRHFNFYMREYFNTTEAYMKLKTFLQNH